jgi:arylsulfatase A
VLIHQADILATLADVVGVRLPEKAGEDSISFLAQLSGSHRPARQYAVSASAQGVNALRQGDWKIIFGHPEAGKKEGKNKGDASPGFLFNLKEDRGELNNLWATQSEKVAELTKAMEKIVADHPNDTPPNWKRHLAGATKK